MFLASCVNTPIDHKEFIICVRMLRGTLRPVWTGTYYFTVFEKGAKYTVLEQTVIQAHETHDLSPPPMDATRTLLLAINQVRTKVNPPGMCHSPWKVPLSRDVVPPHWCPTLPWKVSPPLMCHPLHGKCHPHWCATPFMEIATPLARGDGWCQRSIYIGLWGQISSWFVFSKGSTIYKQIYVLRLASPPPHVFPSCTSCWCAVCTNLPQDIRSWRSELGIESESTNEKNWVFVPKHSDSPKLNKALCMHTRKKKSQLCSAEQIKIVGIFFPSFSHFLQTKERTLPACIPALFFS